MSDWSLFGSAWHIALKLNKMLKNLPQMGHHVWYPTGKNIFSVTVYLVGSSKSWLKYNFALNNTVGGEVEYPLLKKMKKVPKF